MKLGILPLGRPTFDVVFAQSKLAAMLGVLDASGHEIVGVRELLFDERSSRESMAELKAATIDHLLLLQVTFTDSAMAVAAAAEFGCSLSIWAVPEPRLGGRLRLNAFCGLHLASHALGLRQRAFGWLYADPEDDIAVDLADLLAGKRLCNRLAPAPPPQATAAGESIARAVRGSRIARIGEHPAGFDSCRYSAGDVHELAGVEVEELDLEDLFSRARAAPAHAAKSLREDVAAQLQGVDELDQDQLDRSLRLKLGLDSLRQAGDYHAFAIRCWPETFTAYGGAICGPAGMMAEKCVPCACEADVYGALSQLILLETTHSPVFLADVVDMDVEDNTGVIWHCGQAPVSMCDPQAAMEATVHTNRKKPLLFQFPLKPGRVTLMRISQARDQPSMVLARAEVLSRPMAFTGTSGVLRFDRPVAEMLRDMLGCGLEHHIVLAYGDHCDALRGVCGALHLPLLEL